MEVVLALMAVSKKKKKKKKSFGFSSQTKCFKMSPDLKSRKVF